MEGIFRLPQHEHTRQLLSGDVRQHRFRAGCQDEAIVAQRLTGPQLNLATVGVDASQVFIERLRTSGELVEEITRWGLEATGLDMESR